MKRLICAVLPLLVLGGGSLACKKKEEAPPTPAPITMAPAPTGSVSITNLTVGKAVGPDKRVTQPAEAFSPNDTIYAAVETAGTGHAKIRAEWTFIKGDRIAKVDETTIELDATGPTVNEFHVSKPGGWPPGEYRVEIYVNDSPAATKTFTVA